MSECTGAFPRLGWQASSAQPCVPALDARQPPGYMDLPAGEASGFRGHYSLSPKRMLCRPWCLPGSESTWQAVRDEEKVRRGRTAAWEAKTSVPFSSAREMAGGS